MLNYQVSVMIEIRSSLISQPYIISDWLKSPLFQIRKPAMLSNHIWIQYLWLERPLVMTAVRKKVNQPDNVEDQLGLSHWNFSGRNDKRLRQKSQHLFRGVCCRRSQQAKGRWVSYILKISAVFLATWTEHVFVTVLCHFFTPTQGLPPWATGGLAQNRERV